LNTLADIHFEGLWETIRTSVRTADSPAEIRVGYKCKTLPLHQSAELALQGRVLIPIHHDVH